MLVGFLLFVLTDCGCLIGIGRILTNPPSHTTRHAGPHRAVQHQGANTSCGYHTYPWALSHRSRIDSNPCRANHSFCLVEVCLAWGGQSLTLAQQVLEHGSATVAFEVYQVLLEIQMDLDKSPCYPEGECRVK